MDRSTFLRHVRRRVLDYVLHTDDEFMSHWVSEMAWDACEDAAERGLFGARVFDASDDFDGIFDVPHDLKRDVYAQTEDLPYELPLSAHQRIRLAAELRRLEGVA